MKIAKENPHNLAIHPYLIRIYGGDSNNLDLQEDIKKNQIIVPLVASTRTAEPTIVSGFRRLQAAIALGFESRDGTLKNGAGFPFWVSDPERTSPSALTRGLVKKRCSAVLGVSPMRDCIKKPAPFFCGNCRSIPVVYYKFLSEEAEKHFILSANQKRPKSKYQQLLEGREWEKLEKEAALKRRKKGLEQRWHKSVDDFDNHDYYPLKLLPKNGFCSREQNQWKKNSRTIDRVGARIGISAASYQRAKPVIKKCEKLRELGKDLEADVLEKYLESSGINPAARLVKSSDCDAVLKMVAGGEAKNVSIAKTSIARIHKMSAIVPGSIFFFPDNKLRKSTYFHLGRVIEITNLIATVCFRDSIDNDLYEHQYKCDELLCLTREEEDWEQQSLRKRMQYLLSHPRTTPTDRYVLNRLLKPVICIECEIEYLQIIDWRVASVLSEVAA